MSKGMKFDSDKAPLDLIPYEAQEEIAKVLGFGAKKYARGNFTKGLEYSRLIAAALRHLNQFNSGEDKDPESGLSHIAHAGCMIAFLLYMEKNKPEMDDRWSKSESSVPRLVDLKPGKVFVTRGGNTVTFDGKLDGSHPVGSNGMIYQVDIDDGVCIWSYGEPDPDDVVKEVK